MKNGLKSREKRPGMYTIKKMLGNVNVTISQNTFDMKKKEC